MKCWASKKQSSFTVIITIVNQTACTLCTFPVSKDLLTWQTPSQKKNNKVIPMYRCSLLRGCGWWVCNINNYTASPVLLALYIVYTMYTTIITICINLNQPQQHSKHTKQKRKHMHHKTLHTVSSRSYPDTLIQVTHTGTIAHMKQLTYRVSQGLAVKAYGLDVSAPTGHKSMMLPDNSDCNIFST